MVSTAAGKVNFLNVDRVDGKDSSDFLPKDTYVNVVSRKGPGGGGTVFASAARDSGEKFLGGGAQALSHTEDASSLAAPTAPCSG